MRDGVEPFCVGEERVQLPDRVEDQADLSEIETFGNVSEFEGIGNENKTYRVDPVLAQTHQEARQCRNGRMAI